MTTTKSFSDKHRFMSIFRSSLKQQIPFAIVSFIAFALLIGLTYFVSFGLDTGVHWGTDYLPRRFADGIYMVGEGIGGIAMAALIGFALIVALIQHSYLHSKKMTDFYHSLPVKRPHIFCANMLASALAILVPFIVVVLLTMTAQLIQYGQYIPDMSAYFAYIAKDIFSGIIGVLVVYIFTSFIAICVGTVFDAFALTVVLGCTPLAIYMICGLIWSVMIYGASFNADIAFLLSPFTFVFQRYMEQTYNQALDINVSDFSIVPLLVWMGIGLVLFFITVMAYNRRRSELAEQTQPQGIFQIITKCVVAFCGGFLFFAIFYDYSLIIWFFAMIIGALLIGIVVEIVLSRGIRSLKKNAKWLLVSGLLSFALLVGITYDITGAGTYVPDADDIASVSISYDGRFANIRNTDSCNWMRTVVLDEPETIGIITEAHRLAVSNGVLDVHRRDYTEGPNTCLVMDYTLKNGRTISRNYNCISNDAAKKLTELETNEEYLRASQVVFSIGDESKYSIQSVAVSDSLGNNQTPYVLEQAQLEKLLDAVCTDMLGETYDKIANPTAPAYGYLTFQYYDLKMHEGQESMVYDPSTDFAYSYSSDLQTFTVLLTEEYTRTITLMKQYGIYDAETAIPTAEDVGGVLFKDYVLYSYGWSNSTILNVIENIYTGDTASFDDYDGAYNVKTTDKAVISTVLEKGRSQMEYGSEGDIVAVDLYDTDGNSIGTRLMHWDDVPADIQKKLIMTNEADGEMAEETFSVETKTAMDTTVIGGADEATDIVVTDDQASKEPNSTNEE